MASRLLWSALGIGLPYFLLMAFWDFTTLETVAIGLALLGANTIGQQAVARFLRSEAGSDHAAYLIKRKGAFGAEHYVQRLEGAV